MKRNLTILLAALALTGGARAQGTAPAPADLMSLEQDWVSATTSGDRAALNNLLDDSFVERLPNGRVRSRAEVLQAPPPPAGSTQTLHSMQVRINGDWAVVNGVNTYRPSPDGATQDYQFTDMFKRDGDVWKIVSSQMTR